MGDFRRKNIRLAHPSYLGPRWYFLTLCAEGRQQRFRDTRLVTGCLQWLTEIAAKLTFAIPAYCFMPDHLHLLVNGTDAGSDLQKFAKAFKQRSAHAFMRKTGGQLWQGKFYDHILRPKERWESVVWYIWMNPVRKGLCGRPEEWPHSGSFTVDWRRLLKPPEEIWVPPWKAISARGQPGP